MALESNKALLKPGFVDLARRSRLVWSLGSLLALLGVWQIAALVIASRVFPSPLVVLEAVHIEFESGQLLLHVGATLARVVVSFVLAMLIGSAIGLALGRLKVADRFFDSWLIFFLNLPALVIIILCYVWFGLTEVAAITAVAINKIPNVAVTVREGARSLSRDLSEMAVMYVSSSGASLAVSSSSCTRSLQ